RPSEPRRLETDAVTRGLLESVLGYGHGARRPELLRPRSCCASGRAASAPQLCRRLAARVPGYTWPRVRELDRVRRRIERILEVERWRSRADGTSRAS
ncbi:MAG: hypothetical protein R3326_06005, partial [Gemmatimonadota bacterium]|nr:hypothetical protein [Gemmatimonadota bacterium]